jgi:hypothetical protein
MYAAGTAATSINETLGPAVTAGVTLTTGANARDGSCGAVTYILNGTTGVVKIGLGNITQAGCTVYNATDWADLGVVSARYTYPYTYSADTASTNATSTMITQFASYPTLVGLVGTVIFLGIIIGVLVASFAFGRKGV